MRLLCAAVLLVSTPTFADELRATREQPLFEVSHTVEVCIADGVAIYKVRRQFANPGKIPDEAGLSIDLPSGAAATGLRIRAHDTWYDGELMEREKAAALYQELTGLGAYAPKDPALLQWLWADKLYLQVFPVMPGSVSTVEYTLTVPTRYMNGRYWVSYPRTASGQGKLAIPILSVKPAWGTALTPITIDGHRAAADTPVVLVVPRREAWLDAVDASPSASYVASTLVVPDEDRTRGAVGEAKVTIDLAHTYKSDVRIDLVTPQNERVAIFNGEGGDANNIKGTFTVKLPAKTTGAGTWRLVVSDHAALDTGSLDAWSLELGSGKDKVTVAADDVPVFVPDAPESANDAGVAAISIAPPAIDTWTARLGRVVASNEHAFSRLEIDTAAELRPLPKRAQVVFVVDASYSIAPEGIAAQLDTIRAYVSHVPDAEVELVAYRRHAQRVFGKFVPANTLDAALAKTTILPGNGSALEEGAQLATSLLADRKGPRRIVLLTDELLRTALPANSVLAQLAKLPRDVVVHVVVPELADGNRSAELVRDDTDRLSVLATRHHGIFAKLYGLPAKTVKDLAPAVLHLVKPTRIDNVEIAALGITAETLQQGAGQRHMLSRPSAPMRVVVTGELWSDPIRNEVVATDKFSTQTAAFVFGADEHHVLSREEQLKVAFTGRAVSPVTSYVAFEPGTRPSVYGFERSGSGTGSGYGAGHYGAIGGFGRIKPDWKRLVDWQACVKQVGAQPGTHVTLAIETTLDEVVDVAQTTGDAKLGSCLVEAVWSLDLDASTFPLERESHVVEF